MDNNHKPVELLLEKAVEYSKTSLELAKLKTLDKASDIVSSIVPHTAFFMLITSVLLFLNLGLAFWLGKILSEVYLGFFIVAGFYLIIALILHFFLQKRIKEIIRNYIIKQVLR